MTARLNPNPFVGLRLRRNAPDPEGREHALTFAVNPMEPDIDSLDVMDLHANPEELMLSIERFTGRGFWSAGTPFPPIPPDKKPLQAHHKKWRG